MPGGGGSLFRETAGKQGALGHIEPAITPRLEEAVQIVAEQVLIHEGFILLIAEIGQDDLGEEDRVFPRKEEVQFVAGKLRVFRALLLILQFRPIQDESELREIGIMAESREERMNAGERFISLEIRAEQIGEGDGLARGEHTYLFAFGKGGFRIEIMAEARRLWNLVCTSGSATERQTAVLEHPLGANLDKLAVSERLAIAAHDAVLVGHEIEEGGRGGGKEIEKLGLAALGA